LPCCDDLSDSVGSRKKKVTLPFWDTVAELLFFTMNISKKRKSDVDDGEPAKRKKGPDGGRQVQSEKSLGNQSTKDKGNTPSKPGPSLVNSGESSNSAKGSQKKGKGKASNAKATESTTNETPPTNPKHKIKKLVPPRPFPTVPASVSATGPRSAHKEGKNYICLTRKTPLGAYLRRCKEVIMKDGSVPLIIVYHRSNRVMQI
jgi:ribonuclease P/MRP protein subunit RPP20